MRRFLFLLLGCMTFVSVSAVTPKDKDNNELMEKAIALFESRQWVVTWNQWTMSAEMTYRNLHPDYNYLMCSGDQLVEMINIDGATIVDSRPRKEIMHERGNMESDPTRIAWQMDDRNIRRHGGRSKTGKLLDFKIIRHKKYFEVVMENEWDGTVYRNSVMKVNPKKRTVSRGEFFGTFKIPGVDD